MILRRRPAPPLRRLDSRVSRRGLLGAGVLAGVLAASGVPLQARTRGGVLRIALAQTLPEGSGWGSAPAVLGQGAVYDTLTEIGPTGELLGELARSWETDAAARLWHLSLRRDVAFHDGTPLQSSDVVASLIHQRRSPAAWALSRIERIEPQGPHALLIALTEGDPDFPLLLADPALIIGPEGRFDGTGTGLYRVASAQVPGRLRLDRVAAHWKDGRAGWFDGVEAVSLLDPRVRLDALLGGEADIATNLPPPFRREAQAAGLPVVAVQGNRQIHVRLPWKARSLSDLLPRALDREALAADWAGTPAADHPLGPLHPALSDLLPPPYDPEAAAALGDVVPRLDGWDGAPTEEATFRKALSGPWAPIRRHPALLSALAAARVSEGAERAAHFAEAQAICARAEIVTVGAHVPAVTVHAPGLAHEAAVSPILALDGGRLPERWWFG